MIPRDMLNRRDEVLLVAAAFLLGTAPLAFGATASEVSLAAFVLAASIGELVTVDTPRLGRVPVSVAVLAALALLGVEPWLVVAVAFGGWVMAAAVRGLRSQPSQLADLAGRLAMAWALPGAVTLGRWALPGPAIGGDVAAGSIVAVGLVLVVASPLATAARSHDHGGDFLPVLRGQLEVSWHGGLALASTAALAALAYGLLGAAILAVMLLPLLALHVGLGRYNEIRRTYDQTVVAMTRMTELTGHVPPGHGVRVGTLAVAISRELGLSERDVELAERAAYLHEVGRIATDDPERAAHDRDVALAGSEIVRQTGSMPEVAAVIERHRDPYRIPGVGDDGTLHVAARIVRTACEYDRLRDAGCEPWEALDELHLAMAYENDPAVVQALADVVTSGRIAEPAPVGT